MIIRSLFFREIFNSIRGCTGRSSTGSCTAASTTLLMIEIMSPSRQVPGTLGSYYNVLGRVVSKTAYRIHTYVEGGLHGKAFRRTLAKSQATFITTEVQNATRHLILL